MEDNTVRVQGDPESIDVPMSNTGGTISIDEGEPNVHPSYGDINAQPLDASKNVSSMDNASPESGGNVSITQGEPNVHPATSDVNNAPTDASKNVQEFGKMPVQPKADVQAVPKNPPAPPEVTKKASWLHDIAQTMAGGPRYEYNVDPNTGEMKRTPVPVSTKHLGLAIALEAISGGLTGLAAGRGRGAGAAGAAAFQQTEQQILQQQQQQKKEATDDYARKAAITQTNMRMAMNERLLADADIKMHERDVESYKSLYNAAQNANAVEKTGIGEAELHELMKSGAVNATTHVAIPIRVRPALNADGTQAKGANGEAKYEKEYAILRPSEKLTFPKDVRDLLTKYKVQGYVDSEGNPVALPDSYEARLGMIVDGTEKARTIQLGHEMFKGYGNRQNNHVNPEGGTVQPKTAVLPQIADKQFESVADSAADKHNVPQGLMRAVALQEGGKMDTPNSKPNAKGVYAVGPMQVTLATAKSVTGNKDLTEEDIKDPQTNADISAQYLRKLLDDNKGDVKKTLIAYHGAGKDSLGVDGEQYAKEVMARVPSLTNTQEEQGEPKTKAPITDSQIEEVTKDFTPKEWDTLIKAGGISAFINGKPGELSTAEKLAEPDAKGNTRLDSQSVGIIRNAINQVYDIEQHRSDIQDAADQRKVDIAQKKEENKQALEQNYAKQSQAYLAYPSSGKFEYIPNAGNMRPDELKAALEKQGVKVPPELAAMQLASQYRVKPSETFPAKVYKGTPTISAQDAAAYIRQFINPEYDETKWAAANKFRIDLTPGGKVGQNLLQAGIAANHLDLLDQAINDLNNGDLRKWNALSNTFKTEIGDPNKKSYEAIAQVLGNEVGKVVSGGSQAYEAELSELRDRLSSSDSPQTARKVLDDYIKLMNGRINEVNDSSKEYFGTEIHVSPQVAKVFGSHELYVPGYGNPVKQNGQLIGFTKDNVSMTPFKGQ